MEENMNNIFTNVESVVNEKFNKRSVLRKETTLPTPSI